MTDQQQHPITPPAELKAKWIEEDEGGQGVIGRMIDRAAQWGADQELDACCEWLNAASIGDTLNSYDLEPIANDLRAARRPKPPSLKEQALKKMDKLDEHWEVLPIELVSLDIIRRALEALPDD